MICLYLFVAFLRYITMKRFLFLLLFAGIAFSCEKEFYTSIPSFPVHLDLRLDGLDYDLNANLAYKIFTQPRFASDQLGFGGILIVNGMGENMVNLYAYDLSCPVEEKRDTRVVPDKSGVTATCPKCGTVFDIATGTGRPHSGTKYSLRSYRVVGSGMQYTVAN